MARVWDFSASFEPKTVATAMARIWKLDVSGAVAMAPCCNLASVSLTMSGSSTAGSDLAALIWVIGMQEVSRKLRREIRCKRSKPAASSWPGRGGH